MSFIITVQKIIAVLRGGTNRIEVGDILKYEKAYGNLDFISDDDIINQRVVKALILAGGSSPVEISVPSGSARPLIVDLTVDPYLSLSVDFLSQVEQLDAPYATYQNSEVIYDVPVEKNFTDNTHTSLSTVTITGHPSDADDTITQDDLKIILR